MNDESALLRAARRLDKAALAAIFDMYAPAIYRYVFRLCHDPIKSDHIVGNVFEKLLERFAADQGPSANLRSYLFQMAYHSVVDGARHSHRFAPFEEVIDGPGKLRTRSVHGQVEERNLLNMLTSTLDNELSEVQRHVIILRFIENFSLQETAAIVGKTVNHVKVIQNRGIAKLRKSLAIEFSTNVKNPIP